MKTPESLSDYLSKIGDLFQSKFIGKTIYGILTSFVFTLGITVFNDTLFIFIKCGISFIF